MIEDASHGSVFERIWPLSSADHATPDGLCEGRIWPIDWLVQLGGDRREVRRLSPDRRNSSTGRNPEAASRAVKEHLATLNDTALGAATEVEAKFCRVLIFAQAHGRSDHGHASVPGTSLPFTTPRPKGSFQA
jgi:hypothetical protein